MKTTKPMMISKQCQRALMICGMAMASAGAFANGAVSQLSGTLTVQKPDGSVRILSQKSQIQPGDTVTTQRDSYAQVKFPDGGQITLKPNTAIKLDSFSFDPKEPKKDNMVFGLVKGGMRAVTGLVGKRGDPDAYQMNTATATIGIRGTTYGADDCTTTKCGSLQDAVYVSVADGEIVASNAAGSVSFLAGQFGSIESRDRLPRFLSTDPGLQFTPPASFIQSITGGTAVNSGKSMECVVRR
ncbi:MAG: FecR domain-containing protein [Burkholderiales bacterium]